MKWVTGLAMSVALLIGAFFGRVHADEVHEAIYAHDLPRLMAAIKADPKSANPPWNMIDPPIKSAIICDEPAMLALLIGCGADVNMGDLHMDRPLYHAV